MPLSAATAELAVSPRHPNLRGEELAEAVAAAARCRATRQHRMDPIPGDPNRRPSFGSLITYRCELCGVLRYDTVSRLTGDLLTRSYDPPEWYTAANEARHDPAWWRATWWDQLDTALFLDAEPGGHVKGEPAGAKRTPRKAKGNVVPMRTPRPRRKKA